MIALLTLFLQKIKTKFYLISRVGRIFNKSVFNHTWNKFMNLSEQQLLPCHILKVCPVKVINVWQALTKRLLSNMFNSCRKAMILCLSNKSNPIGERIQVTIYAFFATKCKHNFMCCQIVKNVLIHTLEDMILC